MSKNPIFKLFHNSDKENPIFKFFLIQIICGICVKKYLHLIFMSLNFKFLISRLPT